MAPEPVMAEQAPAASNSLSPTYLSRFQLGVEAFGPGIYYSVFGSYRIIKELAVNLGASYFPLSSAGTSSLSVFTVPVSVSLLLGGHSSNFEAIGGLSFLFVSASIPISSTSSSVVRSLDASGSAVMPFFGLGYRLWPEDGGFSFRATLYGMFLPGGGNSSSSSYSSIPLILITPGLSFGYSF